ncbi:hypothetical protein GF386_05790 [Candidatus Pacearchaeota archaeon]|nr:hypothetical protein [Candidatus Pacearchaeota archaeon]MBD3283605.1 hypothetical protein [Candidatus Pacearchaeota archaeon]
MMWNVLFNPSLAERHPFTMMIIGIFYSSVSILLSGWIFPEYASLIMVFFSVMSCLYVVQGAIRIEENKEFDFKGEGWLLREHLKILYFFFFLFIGFVVSFSFWTFILPIEKVASLFSLQASVVEGIKAMVATGSSFQNSAFVIILMNNLKVLFISLIFAFFYGAGAIFVLVWNASVMGFVIGDLSRNTLGFIALPIAFTKYFLHGVPEMLAYITTALAGGIIYVALWRGDFFRPGRGRRIFIDTAILIFVSIILLVIAALIEVYISPFV